MPEVFWLSRLISHRVGEFDDGDVVASRPISRHGGSIDDGVFLHRARHLESLRDIVLPACVFTHQHEKNQET